MLCSCCNGGDFEVIGLRERKLRKNVGQIECHIIRRLRYLACRKIQYELPYFMIPYKRYNAKTIDESFCPPETLVLQVDELTLFPWRSWFNELIGYDSPSVKLYLSNMP
ncbi:DUF6431 domain-containing protein [Metasolibacillus fluoroglycofenilyticus]|uniref:DUF6431 domain-containing protein n=1 Tax=Metasolibacillus fluoroglycofenilyticus TaxID=1239396 RepID=UPI003D2A3DE0